MKHSCLFFHSLPILTNFQRNSNPPPPVYFDQPSPPQFIKFMKNLRVPVYFDPTPRLLGT